MSWPARRRLRARAAALVGGLAAVQAGALARAEESPPLGDARSRILVRAECRSDLGRREVTLFANGTVRLRDGLYASEQMRLGELPPDRSAAFVRRFAAEDLREVSTDRAEVGGSWVERCTLDLALDGTAPRHFAYSRVDALPLALARVLAIVEDLASQVEPRPHGAGIEGLPAGYRPALGDRLRRVDGVLFEVAGETADGKGVELRGVEQPLVVYVPKGELARQFIALEARGRAVP